MQATNTSWGPRLAANPTGALRAAVLVAPPSAIESARPLPGEPNALQPRALAQQAILIKTLHYFKCEATLLEPHTGDPYASAIVDAAVILALLAAFAIATFVSSVPDAESTDSLDSSSRGPR